MTISVVQTAQQTSNPPITFGSAVTAGNSVVLVAACYDTAGTPVTVSGVKLGGSTVTGTVALFNPGGTGAVNSASDGGNVACVSVWLIPNVSGGQTTVDYSSAVSNIGSVAYEVSGLTASPALDQSASGSSISSSTATSGATGAITGAPEFVVGGAMIFSGAGAGAPSGFTYVNPAGDIWVGYQIPTSSGGTYTWTQTSAGQPWAAAVATLQAGGVSVSLTTPNLALAAPPPSWPQVVQVGYVQFGAEVTFSQNVAAGNTIIYVLGLYAGAGQTSPPFSTSNPQFPYGTSVPGTLVYSGAGPDVPLGYGYNAAWIIPNVAGGAATVGVTNTYPSGGGAIGAFALEVANLGPNPVLDPNGGLSIGSGDSTAVACGNTPPMWASADLIVGIGHIYDQALAAPSGSWTYQTGGGAEGNFTVGYQVSMQPGNAYSWSQTAAGAASWGAAVLAITADAPILVPLTAPGLALAAPAVTPVAPANVTLTAPGVALAAPLVTPSGSGAGTVALTAPGLALAAPNVTPPGGNSWWWWWGDDGGMAG
jgi:hypothetical protein